MTHGADDFRVAGMADQQHVTAGPFVAFGFHMDFADQGTGGVDEEQAAPGGFLGHRFRYAMGREDDPGVVPYLVEFVDEQAMTNVGNSLMQTEQEPLEAADSAVVQGMLEGSNVISVTEITRMIQLLRSYQAANNLITTEDEREQQAIEILTRTV